MDGCRSQNPAYRPAGPPIAQRRLLRRLHVRGPRLLRGLLHRGLLALLAALLLFLLLRGGVLLGGGILLLGCAPTGGHRREGPGGGARSLAQGGLDRKSVVEGGRGGRGGGGRRGRGERERGVGGWRRR